MPELDILEKLKLERLERQQKRQAELAKYEAELTARREARKQERFNVREHEKQSDKLMSEMTKKTIEDSFKKIQVNNAVDELKTKEIQSKQRDLHTRIEGDREIFNSRRQRLKDMEMKRKKKKIPPRPKRFIVHPAEFYGIDFSAETNAKLIEQELYDIEKRREEEFLADPNRMDMVLKAGNAFVKALFEATSMDHDAVPEILRKKRFKGSLPTVSEDGEMKTFERKITAENIDVTTQEDVDAFAASLRDLSTPVVLETSLEEESNQTKKKWNEVIPRPQIDYSEVFPPYLGLKEELYVFRIQDMLPKIQPNTNRLGHFCVGDCYIVLHTFETDDGQLESQIYQWVGEESSLDKKACSAIYAVGLRNLLGLEREIIRTGSDDESSSEFINLFLAKEKDYEVIDNSKATESALFSVQEREYPLFVYKISARKVNRRTRRESTDEDVSIKVRGDIDIQLVRPNPRLFKSRFTYLVDNGLKIYQWNGDAGNLTDKMKCRLFGQKIVNYERPPGKATFYEMNQGEESEEFWNIFNAEDLEVESSENLESEPSDELLDDDCFSKIYIFDSSDIHGTSVNEFNLSLAEKYSSDSTNGLPSANLLANNCCAVLDCKAEVFYWVGRDSSQELRDFAQAVLIARIFPSVDRPDYVITSKVIQGIEPEIFKIRFSNWRSTEKTIDYSDSKPTFSRERRVADTKLNADIKAIYAPAWNGKNTTDEDAFYEHLFKQANSLLQSLQAFIFDHDSKKFLRLPDWDAPDAKEKAHLWSSETYVFLCVYKKQTVNDSTENLQGSSSDLSPIDQPKIEFECVTYTWTGRHEQKPSFALLKFEFQFKKVIFDLIQSLSAGTMNVRTVHLQQERESVAFLSHLGKEVIIHTGSRKKPDIVVADMSAKLNPLDICMFHVRTDLKYKVTRAIQVPPVLSSLSMRDCYVIINIRNPSDECNYLWIGRGASKEEERKAASVAQKIYQYFHRPEKPSQTVQIAKEKIEPRAFWSQIAPDFMKPLSSAYTIPSGQGYYHCTPPPRMFKCTTKAGFFQVQDLSALFSVSDLKSDTICILDSGPGLGKPFLVWVWIGKDVSDVVLKLSKKTVDAYLDHQNDGRSLDRSEWDTSEKELGRTRPVSRVNRADMLIAREGSEPVDFKSFFHGWGDTYNINDEAAKTLNLSIDDMNVIKEFHMRTGAKKDGPLNEFQRIEQSKKEERLKQNEPQK